MFMTSAITKLLLCQDVEMNILNKVLFLRCVLATVYINFTELPNQIFLFC